VKLADILSRLRAQFGDETLSRTQVCDWRKSLKEGLIHVENMGKLHLLQGKLWPAFLGFSGVFLIDFLTEQRNINGI
jgi:hypothetical protein